MASYAILVPLGQEQAMQMMSLASFQAVQLDPQVLRSTSDSSARLPVTAGNVLNLM